MYRDFQWDPVRGRLGELLHRNPVNQFAKWLEDSFWLLVGDDAALIIHQNTDPLCGELDGTQDLL